MIDCAFHEELALISYAVKRSQVFIGNYRWLLPK